MWTARSITPAGVVLRMVLGLLLVVGILLVTSSSGRAQRDPYSDVEPTVEPRLIISDVSVERVPENPEPEPSVLPFTGGNVTMLLVAGLGAIAIGTVLVRRRRGDGTDPESGPR
jgi:hypothetical protein